MKFETRNAQGRTCCKTDNPDYLCDACKRAVAAGHVAPRFPSPPNPYAAAEHTTELAVIRDAHGTPDPYATALAAGRTR